MIDDAVLEFVRTYTAENGYPPSTRDLASALGVSSTREMHRLLVQLREQGLVEWEQGRARTLRVVDASTRSSASG